MVASPDFTSTGSTGAALPSRYAGATSSGAPTFGGFSVGDWVIDRTGVVWICTTAGIPGTWTSLLSTIGGTMTGPIAMGSNKITGLANGSAASDAAALGQLALGTNFSPPVIGFSVATATQTANSLVSHVIQIPAPTTLTGVVIVNGAAAAGTVLTGLWNAAGSTLMTSSAATAQTGTNISQLVAFTASTAVAAGTYVLGVIYSSGSATSPLSYSAAPAATAAVGAFTLPTPMTPPTQVATAALAVASTY